MSSCSFFSIEELKELGFKGVGKDVLVSRKASFYGIHNISIGNNVRIDDFCILSGKIEIGNYVHIAAYCALFGGDSGIELYDFSGISSRSVIYAESDDYTGKAMTNPTVPEDYRLVQGGKVVLEKHALIGTGCTILPGVTIGEGASVGSMSLINKSLDSWGMYVGIPCKFIKCRSKQLLDYEKKIVAKDNK